MIDQISNAQWKSYETHGFLRMGRVLSDGDLEALRNRIDDIMLGRAGLDYDRC